MQARCSAPTRSLVGNWVHGLPDSAYPAPSWQRQPVRVSFSSPLDQKMTYSVRGHAVDVVNDEEEEGTK